jgi:plasmid stabilization system protein ParE
MIGSGTEGNDDPLPIYAVRLAEQAVRDLDAAFVWLADRTDVENAVEWRRGFYREAATLATLPRRCPLAPEEFIREVRQFLYRKSGAGTSTAHRVLFTIRGEDGKDAEGIRVVIEHVRHASARPLTPK